VFPNYNIFYLQQIVELTMPLTPKLIKYKKYLYGKDMILKRPLDLIVVGHPVILEKNRAILAKSYYQKTSGQFAKIKIYPIYESIKDLENNQIPTVIKVEYIDSMYIEKEISKIKVETKPHPKIISYYFEVVQKDDYWIFASAYVPEKQKFTQLIALPMQNILKIETCNEI
jgi:hypothetical protein